MWPQAYRRTWFRLAVGLMLLLGTTRASEMTCEEADGLARDLMYEGRLEEARTAFLHLMDICPPDAGRWNDLGQVYWQAGQFDAAVEAFKSAVDLDPANPFIVHNLGALLHYQGNDMVAAEIALEKAIQLAKEQGEETLQNHAQRTLYRCKEHQKLVVQREKLLDMHEAERAKTGSGVAEEGQCAWEDKAEKLLGGEDLTLLAAKFGSVVQVEEREASELSYDEFVSEFALKRRPVVIKGIGHVITKAGVPWDLDYIQRKCGHKTIITRVYNQHSDKWAGLEDYDSPTLADFLTRYKTGGTEEYLFDWSLPKACPELLQDFVVPKYFSGDYLQSFPRHSPHPATHVDQPPRLFADSWPSLFVGPAKSGGGLHVDAFGSNFWMAVFSGYKLWHFFAEVIVLCAERMRLELPLCLGIMRAFAGGIMRDVQGDLPYLYPSHRDDTFGVNTRDPDYDSVPLYAYANASACILGPGDGLFVPAGSPHQVTNLSPSVAISMNYVDASNIQRALAVTGVEGLVDADQAWVHEQLQAASRGGVGRERGPGRDMPWREFKEQG